MTEEEYRRIKACIAGGLSMSKAVAGNKAKKMQYIRMRDRVEGYIQVCRPGKNKGADPTKKEPAPLETLAPLVKSILKNEDCQETEPDSGKEVDKEPQVEITAEGLLAAAKRALYRIMNQGSPLPAYINLVFALCRVEIDSWKEGRVAKQGTDEYQRVIADLLSENTPTFTLLEGKQKDGQIVAAN